MGRYLKNKNKTENSQPNIVSSAIQDAEADHFLDCPNATLSERISATALDFMFLFIIGSFINRLKELLVTQLLLAHPNPMSLQTFHMVNLSQFTLEVICVFTYLVWSIVRWGGSPGKLLLNLRIIDKTSGLPLSLKQALLREFIGKPFIFIHVPLSIFLKTKKPPFVHEWLSNSCVKNVEGDPWSS